VFAGGDIVLGSATVILAMGQGRIAAQSIDDFLHAGDPSQLVEAMKSTLNEYISRYPKTTAEHIKRALNIVGRDIEQTL
jgi:hypothetical protein